MRTIVKENPTIASCAMLFEHDYYPSKGRVFVPSLSETCSASLVISE